MRSGIGASGVGIKGVGAINLGGTLWREIMVMFDTTLVNPASASVTVTIVIEIRSEDAIGDKLRLGELLQRVITLNPGESFPLTMSSQPGQVVETARAGNVVAVATLYLGDVNGAVIGTITSDVLAVIEDMGQIPIMELLGVHPWASRTATAQARKLNSLHPWQGKIYAGYGNSQADGIDRVQISPFNPALGVFQDEGTARSQAVFQFVSFGERLYIPHFDPTLLSDGEYTVGPPFANGYVDTILRRQIMNHVFHMWTLTGTDLWIYGLHRTTGMSIYRSLNGGESWQFSRSAVDLGGDIRFRVVFKGKLYLGVGSTATTGQDPDAFPCRQFHVFDGATWTAWARNRTPLVRASWRPIEFLGQVVYVELDSIGPATFGNQLLKVWDGLDGQFGVTAPLGDKYVWDIATDSRSLYAFDGDGLVWRSNDILSWEVIAQGPANGMSIAELDGYLYVGAEDSKLYRV